ncbi:MAG: chloride channel protein, partial [Roseburia sp.]|nr:chloride channel protein [Roseburia sp.]
MSGQQEIKYRMLRAVIKAARWRKMHLTDNTAAFIIATVTGIIVGFAAFVLKWMIGCVTHLLTQKMHVYGENWFFLLIPVIGILLTGIYVRYILRDDITHGVSKLMAKLKNKIYKLRFHLTYAPLIGSTLTLGFGGSAGSEGPIAYAGAAVGSNMARLMRFSPELMMIMVGCGAGAGIAGIFKAPIGGFLFTLEVLRMQLTTVSVIALLTSSIVAGMTAFALSGFTYDLAFPGVHLFEPEMSIWYLVLGVVCGLYALYYSTMMSRMERVYNH